MGSSTADAGDVNGDGISDILMGAPEASPGGMNGAGSAYVYSGADFSLLHQFDGLTPNGAFATSVSGAGDIDGDGFADLLIGAPTENPNGATDAGSAYVFSGLTGVLLSQLDGALANDQLGYSVAAAGDLNQDGYDDVFIGAPFANPWGRVDAGSATIVGLEPYIAASTHSISASSANTIDFQLSFPNGAASMDYRVLLSSGIGPSFFGVDIPLTQGSLAMNSYAGSYPFPTVSNMHGTLNANSRASASCGAPANTFTRVIGFTIYFAAIASPQGGGLPAYSSIALPVTILP